MPVLEPPSPKYLSTRGAGSADQDDRDDDFEPDVPDVDDVDPPADDGGGDGGDDGDGDPGKWVTVATFWQATQAHIARLRLESRDIDCVIVDENLIATDWLYANAAGGIKVQVREADVA